MGFKYSVYFGNTPFQLESPNANTQIRKYTITNENTKIQIHKYKFNVLFAFAIFHFNWKAPPAAEKPLCYEKKSIQQMYL